MVQTEPETSEWQCTALTITLLTQLQLFLFNLNQTKNIYSAAHNKVDSGAEAKLVM